jgi:DNA invertase Pin-like site-specific DNA recombinase
MDVVLYARISEDREGTHLGVDRQMEDLRALAGGRGDRVLGEFVDDNEPVYRRPVRPPQYRAMKRLVETGAVNAIYVWHPDRLYRSLRDLEDLVDMVDDFDLTICTVRAGSIDLTTPSGRMVARMLGTAARFEVEHKADRIARKNKELAAKGLPGLGGHRPTGYERDLITINEKEAQAIRAAAQALLDGESLAYANRVFRDLVGRPIERRLLRQVLTSPRIAGRRLYIPITDRRRGIKTGTITPAIWPAILDDDTWTRVRQILANPRRSGAGGRPTCLLSGIMICARCGSYLVGATTVYHCNQHFGCAGLSVTKSGAERVITDWCLDRKQRSHLRRLSSLASPDPFKDSPAQIARQTRRRDLAILYADGRISVDEWLSARQRLDQGDGPSRVAALERSRTAASATRALDTINNWDTANTTDRRTALRFVLRDRQVHVAPVANTGGVFNPARVVIGDEHHTRLDPYPDRGAAPLGRCPTKMTPDKLLRAREMLDQGTTRKDIAATLGMSANTLNKHLARDPSPT